MKPGNVIGLWVDQVSEEESHWIVSRDRVNELGEAETTETVRVFAESDYREARDAAVGLAIKEGVPVILTRYAGQHECIWPKK